MYPISREAVPYQHGVPSHHEAIPDAERGTLPLEQLPRPQAVREAPPFAFEGDEPQPLPSAAQLPHGIVVGDAPPVVKDQHFDGEPVDVILVQEREARIELRRAGDEPSRRGIALGSVRRVVAELGEVHDAISALASAAAIVLSIDGSPSGLGGSIRRGFCRTQA